MKAYSKFENQNLKRIYLQMNYWNVKMDHREREGPDEIKSEDRKCTAHT